MAAEIGRTISSFAQGQPEGPRYGRFLTQDRDGNPVNLADIMEMETQQFCRMVPCARDRTLQTLSGLTMIHIRIDWPGYNICYGHVRSNSLGEIIRGIAVVLRQFFAGAAAYEEEGQMENNRAWNITANNITIRDIRLVAINHYKRNVFYCEFERITVREHKPRAF